MRLGKIFVFGALVYASVANAQDVVVDLSVLDDLNVPETNIAQPLFPVLPKKVAVEAKKTVKKEKLKSAPKREPKKILKKVVAEVKPAEDDIVVVDVEPVSTPQQPSIVEEQKHIKPVDALSKEGPSVSEPAQLVPSQETQNSDEDIKAPLVTDIKKTEPVSENVTDSAVSASAEKVEDNTHNDLIIKEDVVTESVADIIKFDEGVDELNEVQMQEIEKIVSKYANGPKNKISIYSYNYDDGVDSFKKKRVSLNRALGIRSYLLKNGYKNFSIKVININPPSDKLNSVELQEI